MKNSKIWTYSIIILILIIGIYFIFFNKPDITGKGVLKFTKKSHDFRDVSVRGGTVNVEIPFVNIGEGDITITSLDSSCGCTTASVVNNGVEGPIFQMAMHGKNPRNWRTTIKPNEQASLKIYYDPAVHPTLRDPVTRVITLFSDDPINPQHQIRIRVNQVS